MTRAYAFAVAALIVVSVGLGCGRSREQKQTTTILTPPKAAPVKPRSPAIAPPAAKPPKPPAVVPPAVKSVAIPTKPVAAASRPVVAASVWQQMRTARKSVRSYKSTVREGPLTTVTYVKMADGRPAVVKVNEMSGAWVLADIARRISYIYNAQDKTIMKIDNSKSGDRGTEDDEVDSMKRQNGDVTSGSLQGMDCWVVKITGQTAATFWLDKKMGLTRQIEDGTGTRAVQVENVNSVPENEFRLPAGVPVKDAAQMMKGMGGSPKPPK